MADEQSIQSPESNPDIRRPDHAAIIEPASNAKAKPKPKPKHEYDLIPLCPERNRVAENVQDERILVVVGHGSCEDRVEQIQIRQGYVFSYTRVGQKIYHTQAKQILSRLGIGVVLSKVDAVPEGEELELHSSNGDYGDYSISFDDDTLKKKLHRDLGYYVYDPEEKLGNKLIRFKDWRHYSRMLEPPQGDFLRMSDVIRFKEKLESDSAIQHVLFLACKDIISEPKAQVSGKMEIYAPTNDTLSSKSPTSDTLSSTSPTSDTLSLKTSNEPDVLIIFGELLNDQPMKMRCDLMTRFSNLHFEFTHASDYANIAFTIKNSKARLIHIEGGHESISGYKLASAVVGRLKEEQEHRCEGCFINAGLPEEDDGRITQLCESHLSKDRPFQVACWQGEVANGRRWEFSEFLYMEYRPNMTLAEAVNKAKSQMIADGQPPLFVTSTKVSIPPSLDPRKKMYRSVHVTLEMTPQENELDTWVDFIESVMSRDSLFWRNHFSCGSQVAWIEVVIQTSPRILKPQALTLTHIRYFEEQLKKQLGVEEVRFSGFGSVILRMYAASFVELRSRWDTGTLEICTPVEWGASKVIVTDISLGTRFWAQFLIAQEDYVKTNLYETMQQHLHEDWNIDVGAGHEDRTRQQTQPKAEIAECVKLRSELRGVADQINEISHEYTALRSKQKRFFSLATRLFRGMDSVQMPRATVDQEICYPSMSDIFAEGTTFLRVDVEAQRIQLPQEPLVDTLLRAGLGVVSRRVSGTDLFHEVYPIMEVRLIRRTSDSSTDNSSDASETYRKVPTRSFICAGEDAVFEPFFIPVEGKELKGHNFKLELRLIHKTRAFRSEVLLATFSCDGTFSDSSEVLVANETAPEPDEPRCKVNVTCCLLDAAGSPTILARSSEFTLIQILSKLIPILAGPSGIELLLNARPTELRSGDESEARAELDKLRRELQNTMSTLEVSNISGEDDNCHEAAMIDSLKLITRGLLNFSDRFRTHKKIELPDLVVQWIKSFFKLCCGEADLSFNEGRLRRLLAAAQVQAHDLEPVQEDGEVLAWAGSTKAVPDKTDENDRIEAWFRNALRISKAKEMEKAMLGEGSFGCVWRAKSKLTGAMYAIKNVVPNPNDSKAKQLAAREADLLKVICADKHPCVVGLYLVECDPAKSMYAHVMELCLDGDLQSKIEHGLGPDGSYTIPALANIWIGEIFMALSYLYLEIQVLHRDVKPTNVVLNKNVAKLSDFGLTNRSEEVEEKGGQWTFGVPPGTRVYAAPEVIKQQPYNEKADLYSFGVLTWVLLSGGVNVSPGYPPRDPQDNYANDYMQMQRCVKAVNELCVKGIHVTESHHAEGHCRIEQVSFLYSNGKTATCGTDEGQPSSKGDFDLLEGEYITKVFQKGKKHNGNVWLAMIQFVTNKGRLSPAYGDESASEVYPTLITKKSRQICALQHSTVNGCLKMIQDWDRPPKGLVALPPVAADLVLQLVQTDPEERPSYGDAWCHAFMRDMDLPSIADDELEDIQEWIEANTP